MTASTRAYLWPARGPATGWVRLDYTVVRRGVNGSRWMRAIRSLDYREIAPNRQINGPGESRTPDKRFRKPLLYPSELQARRGSLKLFQILADWGRQERPDSRKTLFSQRNLRLLFPTVGYGLKGFLT